MTSQPGTPRRTPPRSSAARWPDLLIGLLVVLLLGGFGFLLFGQRSSTAVQTPAGTTPLPSSPSESAAIPEAPGTVALAPSTPAAQPAPAPAEGSTTPEPTAQTPALQTPATGATTPQTPTPAPTEVPTLPASPVEPAQLPQTPATTEVTGEPTPTGTEPVASPDAPPTLPARAEGAVAASENRTPLRSDYRISLGTFTSTGTATAQTAGVSGLGYQVYPIDLGTQVVAQVGPFADEATARAALADIQRAYPGAILYPPRGRALTGASTAETTTPQASVPQTPEVAATAPATPPARASSEAGPVYLQVGAFDRVDSAQNLVGTLRDQGFAPTVNAPEGRKVTVLVGPFSGAALTRAEERLSATGLDSFRVR